MPSDLPTLTIVMPVFNEATTVRQAVERMLAVELPTTYELLIVNDGSTDGSAEILDELASDERVRVIHHPRNRGKGAAVRTGIAEADGDFLTILDADMEYDPADFVPLLRPILAGEASIAYGTREFGAHTAYSFWYVLGNKVVNLWASFLFNTWLTDVETCFKVAPTETWRRIAVKADGFGLEAEATAKFLRAGNRIYEVPITYRARGREEGKKLVWMDGVEALLILLRIRLFG